MPDVTAPESPEATIERIGKIPPESRTRAQDTALNRAIVRSGSRAHVATSVPVGEAPPCPDPLSPDAAKQLWAAWYRRSWDQAHDPTLTNLDVKGGFDTARMAAAIGKEAAAPTEHALDMASMLGNAPDVTCPACAHRFDPAEGSAGNVGAKVDEPGD